MDTKTKRLPKRYIIAGAIIVVLCLTAIIITKCYDLHYYLFILRGAISDISVIPIN